MPSSRLRRICSWKPLGRLSGVSRARWGNSFKKGNLTEERFTRAVYGCEPSSKEDNINRHIDYRFRGSSVDVKGNNEPREIWVEIKNVRGDKGWLYGDADWIAFDMPEVQGFMCVSREELKEFIEGNVTKRYVSKKDSYLKLYQRKDRKDVITKIVITDLIGLPSLEVVKYSRVFTHPVTGDKIDF